MDTSPSSQPSSNEEQGYHRFHHLDGSMFPSGNNDFTSDFALRTLGEEGEILDNAFDQATESWRYAGSRVYTGEAFAYAPRPRSQPQGMSAMCPSGENQEVEETPSFPDVPVDDRARPGSPPQPPQSAFVEYTAPVHSKSAPAPLLYFLTAQSVRDAAFSLASESTWTRATLLILYRWKVIKKKGSLHVLPHFPGQTEDSLRWTWNGWKAEIKQLWVEETGVEIIGTSEA